MERNRQGHQKDNEGCFFLEHRFDPIPFLTGKKQTEAFFCIVSLSMKFLFYLNQREKYKYANERK